MINCIKAEFFRCRKDRFPLVAFVFVLIGFVITTLLAGAADKLNRSQLLASGWMDQYFSTMKFAVLIFYYVWFQEYRHETRKNICTSGIGITRFYLSKLAVQVISIAVLLVWSILCFSICFLTLGSDTTDIAPLINERIRGFGLFTLYTIAEISVINLMFCFIKNEAAVFLIFLLAIENFGSIAGGFADSELLYSITLEAAYDYSSGIGFLTEKMLISAASMLVHIIIINLCILLKLRKEVHYEKKD